MRRSNSRIKKRRRVRHTRRLKGGNPKKDFIFHNRFHYGDHIFNLKFLFNISNVLKERGIKITYLYDPAYIKNVGELERYVNKDVVTLDTIPAHLNPVGSLPPEAIELWLSHPIDGVDYRKVDVFFDLYYKNIVKILGIQDAGVNTSLYQKEDYLQDLYNKFDNKFKDLDILVINADPQSGQLYGYDKRQFDTMCKRLHKGGYKMATTTEVDASIPCTYRDGLALQDIGAVSTHAKCIIAINSGPVVPCYNEATQKSVKKWILFVDGETYTFKDIPVKRVNASYNFNAIEHNIKPA
jgi:hypothetical protein